MKKVIIAIHGLGNKPNKKLLEEWWWKAISEGLLKYTSNKFEKPEFKLVYWTDVLHKLPEDENCRDPKNPLFLDEKYEPESEVPLKKDHTFRKKIIDALLDKMDNIFLNDDYSLNYSGINDLIMENYFNDLNAYYSNRSNESKRLFRDIVQEKLKSVLTEYRRADILLIAHSMGTIIAYDVLTSFHKKLKVNTFLTIGSPLGFPAIISKIAIDLHLNNRIKQKPKIPACIQNNWFNFSDLEDKVAFNYQLSKEFSENRNGVKIEDFIVSNNYVYHGNHNPHKSYGYLRTAEVAEIIHQFMTEKPAPVYKQIWYTFKKMIKNVKSKTE